MALSHFVEVLFDAVPLCIAVKIGWQLEIILDEALSPWYAIGPLLGFSELIKQQKFPSKMPYFWYSTVKVPISLKRGEEACLFEKLPDPLFFKQAAILLFIFYAYNEKFRRIPSQELDHYLHYRGEITVLVCYPMIH